MLGVYLILLFGIGLFLKNVNCNIIFESESDSILEDYSFFEDYSDNDISNIDYDKINFSETVEVKYFTKYENKNELWYSNNDFKKFMEDRDNEYENENY